MIDESAAAKEDIRLWREEIRSLPRGGNLVTALVCVALGVWGVFDSLSDADGDRFWGTLPIIVPGVFAGWCILQMTWRRLDSLIPLLLRFVSACLIAPLFVAVPIGIVQAVAVAFPGVRDEIARSQAANNDFHYWWAEGIGSQLVLVPFAGYMLGGCIALGVSLIIVFPVISLRAPAVVASGSHLEKVPVGQRDYTAAFVFVGLGATVLGIALWNFGRGGSIAEFPEGVARLLEDVSYGYFFWEDTVWLFGVVFVVIGVALMAAGCLRVMFARSSAAADTDESATRQN
ncbi:hypothetical protein [Microbacterium paludicola]|uniref:hypothetical protein n=1 Tax=Microbacterium paludicola TaxID=300019 RepID=UPI0011A7DE38|nr:hypothetical protein [Microbacterium paludicola]